ncbi:MAG: hypothetical protein Q7T50_01325 [Candidatus Magasanikbacteria bacterium]|nr:hypothetical protein [Candidatus Magasanikbacteria bacterium]
MEIRTKKIISYSLLALVVIGVLVFVLFKNKLSPDLIRKEEKKMSAEELEADFVVKNRDRERKAPVSNRPVEVALLPEQCDSIKNEDDKKLCHEYINLALLIKNSELTKCVTLSNELSDVCVYEIIKNKRGDYDQCVKIESEAIENLCYKNAAIFSRSADYCEKISVDTEKIECSDYLLSTRVELNDITQCALIKTPLYFANCVKNTQVECSGLPDENLIKQCQDWRYLDDIIANGDGKYCDILKQDNFKKVCLAYFKKNKYKDSDADDSSDREELERGTDPFVFDAELKAQTETRIKGADPVATIMRETRKRIDQAIKDEVN